MAALAASASATKNLACPFWVGRGAAHSPARSIFVPRRSSSSRKLRALTTVRAEAVESLVEAAPLDVVVLASPPVPENKASSLLSGFLDSTKAALEDAVEAVSDAADSAKDAAQDMADNVVGASQTLLDKAKAAGPKADTALPAPRDDVAADVTEVLEGAPVELPSVPDVTVDGTVPDVPGFSGAEVPAVPDVPGAESGGFSLPRGGRLPDFKAPDFKVPEFKLPEFNFNAPQLSLPKFEKPEFKLPDFSSPDFNLQDAIKSKLSEIPPPELPESIKSKLPVFTPPEFPSLPKPALPSLESVKAAVPLPKLSLPPAVTEPVKAAASDASAAVSAKAALLSALFLEQATVLYGQLKEQVPAEYQPYVARVESNLESFSAAAGEFSRDASSKLAAVSTEAVRSAFAAAGYEVDESVVTATLISVGTALFIVAYYRAVYGGYSGDLTPQSSLKLLRDTQAVLLDLRPESVREQDGIPDLRRGARGKNRNLEFEKYSGGLRSQLRSPDSVDLQLFAATVKGLKGVGGGTSVVVMDETGSGQAKEVARALAKYGFKRSYILEGGFRAWVDEGLLVRSTEPLALAEILGDEFEAFVEEVKPTPEGVAQVLLATGVGVYALWEWERSLQIIGVALAAQVIYSRAKTYETSADLQRDIRIVTAPFWLVATVLGWVVKAVSPATASPQLATAGADVEASAKESSPLFNGAATAASSILPPAAEAASAAPAAPVAVAEKEEAVPAPPTEEAPPAPPEEAELPAAPEEPLLTPAPPAPKEDLLPPPAVAQATESPAPQAVEESTQAAEPTPKETQTEATPVERPTESQSV